MVQSQKKINLSLKKLQLSIKKDSFERNCFLYQETRFKSFESFFYTIVIPKIWAKDAACSKLTFAPFKDFKSVAIPEIEESDKST